MLLRWSKVFKQHAGARLQTFNAQTLDKMQTWKIDDSQDWKKASKSLYSPFLMNIKGCSCIAWNASHNGVGIICTGTESWSNLCSHSHEVHVVESGAVVLHPNMIQYVGFGMVAFTFLMIRKSIPEGAWIFLQDLRWVLMIANSLRTC